MKSKCGLGVLLLAALLSAIAIWLLPVSSAAADILLLLTGGADTTTRIEASEIQTYGMPPTLKSGTNPTYGPDFVTDFENNVTLSVPQTHYPVIPDNIISTSSPDSSLSIADLTSDVQTNTRTIPGTEVTDHTQFSPSLPLGDQQSVTPGITTVGMEMDKSVCTSGPTDAEVLAIAIGAIFLTILLSALLYQFTVFMRNRKAQRDSSVFIIENELHKYDIEENGLETKL